MKEGKTSFFYQLIIIKLNTIMKKFAGISSISSIQTSLVKVQSSNIKISHSIIKLVDDFNAEDCHVTLEFEAEEKKMYLVIVKPTEDGNNWAELNNAKILDKKYYTLNNSAISSFVGGECTELDYDKSCEIESDENFIFIPLKTVVTGEEGRAEKAKAKQKRAEADAKKESLETVEEEVVSEAPHYEQEKTSL